MLVKLSQLNRQIEGYIEKKPIKSTSHALLKKRINKLLSFSLRIDFFCCRSIIFTMHVNTQNQLISQHFRKKCYIRFCTHTCTMYFFQVQTLEQENAALKKRIQELERMKGVEPSQQVYMYTLLQFKGMMQEWIYTCNQIMHCVTLSLNIINMKSAD